MYWIMTDIPFRLVYFRAHARVAESMLSGLKSSLIAVYIAIIFICYITVFKMVIVILISYVSNYTS
jgi:hypothetical protein